ncbi:MAG: hypothetical protein PHH82_00055 [Candidatus ainarchaeum sp.]|nr:hypothetical protein [Candidatus ainarchaeum sp.]
MPKPLKIGRERITCGNEIISRRQGRKLIELMRRHQDHGEVVPLLKKVGQYVRVKTVQFSNPAKLIVHNSTGSLHNAALWSTIKLYISNIRKRDPRTLPILLNELAETLRTANASIDLGTARITSNKKENGANLQLILGELEKRDAFVYKWGIPEIYAQKESNTTILDLHSHPERSPFSLGDLTLALNQDNNVGIIIPHRNSYELIVIPGKAGLEKAIILYKIRLNYIEQEIARGRRPLQTELRGITNYFSFLRTFLRKQLVRKRLSYEEYKRAITILDTPTKAFNLKQLRELNIAK